MLFYHGMSDPWFSPVDTIDYYERIPDTGGMEKVRKKSSRTYLVPGMGHCSGGRARSFDLLGAVVDWVEDGKAPEASSPPGRFSRPQRPLCAYPKHAQYKGRGDPENAASSSADS